MYKRFLLVLACAVAGCTSSAPNATVVEVDSFGPSAAGQSVVATNPDGTPVIDPSVRATPIDADSLNLTLYTIEQQKIDARIAQQELDAARAQLVIVEPGPVPQANSAVNIALFAQQTTNRVGERVYSRNLGARATATGNCRRFRTADEAQRAFLEAGGPQRDTYGLDPDGDGFACGWDPTPYRRLAS
jgi:hypothetical protein